MSYVPVNLPIYLAAFEGAYSGMTGGLKTLLTTKIVDGAVVAIVSADYLPQATAAGLWAQEYDTVWDSAAAANSADLENTTLLSYGAWLTTNPSSTKVVDGETVPVVAADYLKQVTAIITAVEEADAYFAAQSPPIVVPPPGAVGLDYAAFYGSSAGTPTTAPGVAVAFATAGPTNGVIVGTGSLPTHDFLVPNAGVYDISWQLTDTTGATQTVLALGGTGAYAPIADTCVGRATGTSQMQNRVLVTLTAGAIVSVINPAGNANTISQPPPDGTETHINFASLVIRRVA
jgi:hypothetical protein